MDKEIIRERHRERIRGVEPLVQQAAETLRKRATPAEALLWQALRGRACGGMKFRRQHAVGPFILDFYCPEARLVVEVDGEIHDSPDTQEHDALRSEHLERYGYRVLRVRNAEVISDLPGVLALIERAAKEVRVRENARVGEDACADGARGA
jgi:very-short-patch-repair endonuclease